MSEKSDPKRAGIVICRYRYESVDRVLEEIALGIEEEGVPFFVVSLECCRHAAGLALEAARRSSLSFGVGCGRERAVFTHRLSPEGRPLLEVEVGSPDPGQARLFGNNAARLAKGLPVKRAKI